MLLFEAMLKEIPLNEYKKIEAFILFESMLSKIRLEVTKFLAFVQIMSQSDQQSLEEKLAKKQKS